MPLCGEFIDRAAWLTYVKRHLSPVVEMHGAQLETTDPTGQSRRRQWELYHSVHRGGALWLDLGSRTAQTYDRVQNLILEMKNSDVIFSKPNY